MFLLYDLQAKKQYEQRSSEAHNGEVAFNKAKQEQNFVATKDYDKVSLLHITQDSGSRKNLIKNRYRNGLFYCRMS